MLQGHQEDGSHGDLIIMLMMILSLVTCQESHYVGVLDMYDDPSNNRFISALCAPIFLMHTSILEVLDLFDDFFLHGSNNIINLVTD